MLPIAALVASLCVLVFALVTAGRGFVISRRRRRGRRTVYVGAEAAVARVGDEQQVGSRRYRIVGASPKRGTVDVEPVRPPTAASRKAPPGEMALLRALGFDPKTHDLQPVLSPFRGVQVTKDGRKVRFVTEDRIRGLRGEWQTMARAERIARQGA